VHPIGLAGDEKELDMMVEKSVKEAMLGVVFLCLSVFVGHAHGGRQDITMAILPCTDVVMTFKKFHPLISYLKQQTDLDIRLVVPEDFGEFDNDVKNGHIDFAFQDPNTYVSLASWYDKDTLLRALTRDGARVQSGVVITRKDSGIKTLEDLRGKTVMFGPKPSATKWVAAKLLFEQRDMDIDKDLKSYSRGGCCEDIAFNVYIKAVDAGVVCDHFLDEHSEKQKELGIDPKDIAVIGRTEPVPTKVLAARRDVNKDIITIISKALLQLDRTKGEHAKLLYPAELGGFEKSKDGDYDGIRTLIGKGTED
jgi:phosphate/phosphite/phosphonate ABC transporter binding protein